MVIDFLGDSITEGIGASSEKNFYVSRVRDMLGATVYNCGISGTRIAKRNGFYNHKFDIDFGRRVEDLPMPADYVFVFGGTNDYGHGTAPIGCVSDDTPWTFCGAVNCLIDKLEKVISHDKIVFITPCKRVGWANKATFTNGNLKDFFDALVAVLNKRNVKYIDLWELFAEADLGGKDYFADNVHPNDNGHAKIAQTIVEFIKNDTKNK